MLVLNKVPPEGCVIHIVYCKLVQRNMEIYKSRPWATSDKKCERVDGSKVAPREISGR